MPKANLSIESMIVGSIAFETQNFYGRGGPEFPLLSVLIDLSLCPYSRYGRSQQPTIHPLTLLRIAGEFSSPPDRVVARFHDEIVLFATPESGTNATQWRPEIPLDLIAINRIEQARSGDLRAAFTFRPLFVIHSQDGPVQSFQIGRADTIGFSVPKSQWVEQILPQLGYGRLELLELRISAGAPSEGLPKTADELRQAQDSLRNGEWAKAVAHCRNAIEAIPNSRNLQITSSNPSFGLKVDTLVNEHLKSNIQDEQAKLLADEFKSIWNIASKAVHPSAPDYFKRADAEFLVRKTAALAEYVGKLLGP